MDIKLSAFQDQFNDNQPNDEEVNKLKDLEAESNDDITLDPLVRAKQLVDPERMRKGDIYHKQITKEMHNLVCMVGRITDKSKRIGEPGARKTTTLRTLLRSKLEDDSVTRRNKPVLRGAVQSSRGGEASKNRSFSYNPGSSRERTSRSVKNSKGFRITNKSMAV